MLGVVLKSTTNSDFGLIGGDGSFPLPKFFFCENKFKIIRISGSLRSPHSSSSGGIWVDQFSLKSYLIPTDIIGQ